MCIPQFIEIRNRFEDRLRIFFCSRFTSAKNSAIFAAYSKNATK